LLKHFEFSELTKLTYREISDLKFEYKSNMKNQQARGEAKSAGSKGLGKAEKSLLFNLDQHLIWCSKFHCFQK